MSLSLHTLRAATGARKRRKRVGRGNASGHGTYSGRGQKGQRSRTGGRKGLQKKAIHSLIFRLPKNRGFRSLAPETATVTLAQLAHTFPEGAVITPRLLAAHRLVRGSARRIRVVGGSKLTKRFIIRAHGFSSGAVRGILEAGGQVHQL